ncbi:hypothetical protein ACTFIY_001948 [Dictyostelium cf. discoideum]
MNNNNNVIMQNNNYNNNNNNNNKNSNKNNSLKRKLYDNENIFQEAVEVKDGGKKLKFVNSVSKEVEEDELIEEKNLNYLWSLSHCLQPINPSLGGYYMYKFREIANIAEMNGVPDQIETRNCKNCGTFLIPGVNCRVRIVKRSDLSIRSKSLISTTNLEINSLSSKLKQQSSLKQNQSKKPTNALIQFCLQCCKLNPIKGEPLSKRNSRKQFIKKEKEIIIKNNYDNNNKNNNNNNNNLNNLNNINNIKNNSINEQNNIKNLNEENNSISNNKNNSIPKNKNNNSIPNNKNNNKSTTPSKPNNNNNNNNNSKKVKITQAGSKNIQNKEDNLKDFLSNIGGLLK